MGDYRFSRRCLSPARLPAGAAVRVRFGSQSSLKTLEFTSPDDTFNIACMGAA